MNTPNLSAAVAQEKWDIAAHLLVYGLIRAQTNGSNGFGSASPALRGRVSSPDAPAPELHGQPEGA
jgi:hypothetical protein